jgi:hypothetical protein
LKRYLLNAATVISLLLLLATAASWAAGPRWREHWLRLPGGSVGSADFIAFRGGGVFFVDGTASQSADGSWVGDVSGPGRMTVRAAGREVAWFEASGWIYTPRDALWFRTEGPRTAQLMFSGPSGGSSKPAATYRFFLVPPWMTFAALAALPALRLFAYLDRRRRPPGLCPRCGYDLRASPERCPECGSAPAPST